MNTEAQKLYVELTALFLVVPLFLALPFTPLILVTMALSAVIYVLFIARCQKLFGRQQLFSHSDQLPWRSMLIRFSLFALISGVIVWLFLPEKLFFVVGQNPLFWLRISLVYTTLSVFPQEFIYRYFFFHRYQGILSSRFLIPMNAVAFCLAHTLFMNNLVFALTLAGGFLFAHTYQRTRSLVFTSIEHTLYGLWLFTVGLGEMLAFPST